MGINLLSSDLTELLETHKLSNMEMIAGNTNVFNAIQAINDELLLQRIFDTREAGNYSIIFFS